MKNPIENAASNLPDPSLGKSLYHTRSEMVGVIRAAREYRLVAMCPIRAGERLFTIEGEQTTIATRYSVQIGEDLHIDLRGGHSAEEILDRYFWRFMNHSCEPNSLIRNRDVIAQRDILPWEAVTFDYNTTEWEMAEPFDCGCGSANCLGTIRGVKHLTAYQRERLGKLAPHLNRYLAEESRIPVGMSHA